MQGIGVDLMTKEEYLKKHNVTEKMFLTYCVNALNDNFMRNDDDNINDLKGFLYDLIYEHFNGVDNLNEVIEVQKNNLTDSYMIGLYNGLVTAKNILLAKHVNDELVNLIENIKPYKFEDLKVGMWVLDRKPECEEFTFIKITRILSESDCEYLYHDKDKKVFFDNMECHAREFEENRFFPVQMANLRR